MFGDPLVTLLCEDSCTAAKGTVFDPLTPAAFRLQDPQN
jgi:hypothetical protein